MSRCVLEGLAGLESATTRCSRPAHGRRIRVCIRRPREPGPAVRHPQTACDLLRPAANADRESFWAIHLDTRLRAIGVEEVAKGTLAEVAIHPRELYKGALLSNAGSLAVAHSHPSGDPEPSAADIALTERLVAAGHLLGVPIVDHVILAGDHCVSLRERRPSLFEV